MKINKKLRCFTLLEILLYIAMASIITLSIAVLVTDVLQLREKNRAILEVETQGTLLMQNLTQTIRNARSVTYPLIQSSSQVLEISSDDAPANPTIFEATGDSIGIKQAGQVVATPLLSEKVAIKDVSFENLSDNPDKPDSIKINFTLYYKTNEARGGYDYEKKFYSTTTVRNIL